MKRIEIEIPDGKRAEWVNGVLTLVDEKPKDVTERIKTFEDACNELGDSNIFVKEYKEICLNNWISIDMCAYLKLRIVCAALNEGWEPKFTEDEWRWHPWFNLYTKKELDDMSQEEKDERCIIDVSDRNAGYYAGLAFANSYNAPSDATAYFGSRLCLKNSDLAEYCGRQFINLWADYLLRRK